MSRNTMERMASQFSPPALQPFHQGVQGSILASLLTQQLIDPETGLPRAVNAFSYGAAWVPLAASSTGDPRSIQISATHDFLVFSLTGTVRDVAGALLAAESLTIDVQSDAGNTNLTDRVQDWTNLVGSARDPFWLPVPLFLRAGSTTIVTLTNNVATASNVRLALNGCKVFFGEIG